MFISLQGLSELCAMYDSGTSGCQCESERSSENSSVNACVKVYRG
jgi:hypothetical protein